MAFPGTFIAVSHDRYFLDKTANCTLVLNQGTITEYLGGYSYYLMKKEEESSRPQEQEHVSQKKKTEQPPAQKNNSHRQSSVSTLPTGRRQEMIERAEAEIAMAEAELKGLEYEMNLPETQCDPERSRTVAAAYAEKEQEIIQRYAKWEQLTEVDDAASARS